VGKKSPPDQINQSVNDGSESVIGRWNIWSPNSDHLQVGDVDFYIYRCYRWDESRDKYSKRDSFRD